MGRPPLVAKTALLAQARRVFLDQGLGAPMREIAERVGLSEAALFKRFPHKTDLMIASMAPPPPDTAALLAPLDRGEDARTAIAAVVDGLLAYYRDNLPVVMPLLMHPDIAIGDLANGAAEPGSVAIVEALGERLRDLSRKGLIAENDGLAAAGLIVAWCHSIALFEMMGVHGGKLPQDALAAMLDTLWTGLNPKTDI